MNASQTQAVVLARGEGEHITVGAPTPEEVGKIASRYDFRLS
jgi:hypothetical protein